MSRSALREVLLDLKSQMRGARASTYLKRGEKKDEGEAQSKSRDGLADDGETMESAAKAAVGPQEPPLDFADEMKNFMKKQRKPESTGPSARVSFMAAAKADPKSKKGKA